MQIPGRECNIIYIISSTGIFNMAGKKPSSKKYSKVNPEDFYSFEDRYLEKGGGGSGSKAAVKKGPKTFSDMKRQQHRAAQDQRQAELEDALCLVLDGFPEFETEDLQEGFINQYVDWVEANLARLASPDPSQVEIGFSKSGGPGGQNVNKRETKVSLLHKPTQIRVSNDQTRSQIENRELAQSQLQQRLQDHIRDWRLYLGPGQRVDLELVRELLERDI
jgi:hypothetical protein